jgi:hypothetical protein
MSQGCESGGARKPPGLDVFDKMSDKCLRASSMWLLQFTYLMLFLRQRAKIIFIYYEH